MEKLGIKNKSDLIKIIVCIAILILAIVIRSYRLDEIPVGINVDEAGMAYDAFCLLHFRVDRALNHMPVYLVNFGGGQSVFYAYSTAIMILLFGFRLFSFRITAVIVNIVAIFFGYLLIKRNSSRINALIFMALLTINPWNIMASRWGLDCNLLAPFMLISVYFLTRSEKWYHYIIAGIAFGITLYTYALSYVILPVFLFLALLYMLYVRKISFKNVVIMGVPLFLLALPLILMILVNNGIIDQINWLITIPKLPNYRNAEISISNFISQITNPRTLFVYDNLPFNSVSKFGTIYKSCIPFAILGFVIEAVYLVKSIKAKEFRLGTIFFIWFVPTYLFLMFIQDINVSKANAIFIPLIYFQYSCFEYAISIVKGNEEYKKPFFALLITVMTVLYVCNFGLFSKYYFTQYEKDYAQQMFFENELLAAIEQINGIEEYKNKDVYFYTAAERPYIYTLIMNPISPYEFNETRGENDSYGRYHILSMDDRQIHEDAVYVVRVDTDFVYELAEFHGFNYKQVGTYMIMFKNK